MISINLEKIKYNLIVNAKASNKELTMECIINSYNNYIECNNFNDLTCPCCKNKGTLTFHKCYNRNLIYIENGDVIDNTIDIAVLVCSHCKKNGNKQKYHALLPCFVLPYHIYESSLIINAIYKYLNKIKLEEILDAIKITHKLFYDWLKKFNTYIFSSSILLKENNVMTVIIDKIYKLKDIFLNDFYQFYNHPYFLFRNTCVTLCITP